MPDDENPDSLQGEVPRRKQGAQPRESFRANRAAFPELDGSHMQLCLLEREWQIVSREESTLAVVNRGMRRPRWFLGNRRKVRSVHTLGGPEHRRGPGDRLRRVAYVDTDSGAAVIETDGRHLSYSRVT